MLKIIFTTMFIISGCDVASLSLGNKKLIEESVNTGLDLKVKRLNDEIKSLDINQVKSNLNKYEKIKFQKRFDELVQEANYLIKTINEGEVTNEMQLNNQYAKTKTMWRYLVNNFNI